MNVALVGPTCAGKTTCANRLEGPYGLRHLSTGQLLRENWAEQTALGILTRKYVERGELAPDEIINAMIESALRKIPIDNGLLLDGFPSTLYQARFLDELFEQTGRNLDAVILMQVDEATVFERSARRAEGRPDDRPEILHRRLQLFARTTGPVLDFYRKSGRLAYLDASGSVEAVTAQLEEMFDRIQAGQFTARLTPDQEQILDNLIAEPARTPVKVARPSLDMVLMGGPGSGKGTHSAFLAKQLHIPHIATGNLFRENLSDDTILGKIAHTYIDRGELVPDDVTEAMVRERLSRNDTEQGFILDGFPRTLPQANALDEIMDDLKRRLDTVFYLVVPDEEIIERISGRRICPLCQTPYHIVYNPPKVDQLCDHDGAMLYQRDDDDAETIRARLKVFHGQTMPVIDYYRKAGLLVEITGSGEVDEVDQRLLAVAQKIQPR